MMHACVAAVQISRPKHYTHAFSRLLSVIVLLMDP